MLRFLKWFMKGVNTVCEYVTSAMMVVMTLSILFQVCCRALGTGFDWTEELARYLLVAIVLLGTGIGVYRGGNIGIEAVVNLLPATARKCTAIFMDLCCILLFSEIVRYGWKVLSIVKRQRSASLGLSMSIPYAVILVGSAIILMHIIVHLLTTAFEKGEAKPEEKTAA